MQQESLCVIEQELLLEQLQETLSKEQKMTLEQQNSLMEQPKSQVEQQKLPSTEIVGIHDLTFIFR